MARPRPVLSARATSTMRACSVARLFASLNKGTTMETPVSAQPRERAAAPPTRVIASAVIHALCAFAPLRAFIAQAGPGVARVSCHDAGAPRRGGRDVLSGSRHEAPRAA